MSDKEKREILKEMMQGGVIRISNKLKEILITASQTGYFTRSQYEYTCLELNMRQPFTKEQLDALIEKL